MASDSARHNGDDPLWAYRPLAPCERTVHVRGFRAASPQDPVLMLWSEDGMALIAVAGRALGSAVTWPALPFARPVDLAGQPGPTGISIIGIPMEANRRPTPATLPGPGEAAGDILLVDQKKCDGCGMCLAVCPSDCFALKKGTLLLDEKGCIECYACVEVCDRGAMVPMATDPETVMCPDISRPRGFLSKLTTPASTDTDRNDEIPGWQAPRTPIRDKPFYVLGLAVATMQENGAALLRDGMVVGAVEEERLSRIKHHGFRSPGRRRRTICNDLSLRIEEAFAWRSVRFLLDREGITLDDIDVFAINGIPGRYRRSYSLTDAARPPRIIRSGRFVFVPHHLAHAASAFYPSGFEDAMVFTVDGRGDRETAAVFNADRDGIVRVFDILSLDDSSLGGVYETISRILGFGAHGQGSTMALAAMGEPVMDMNGCLSAKSRDHFDVHEKTTIRRYGHLARNRMEPITEEHRNLAASAQKALEDSVIALIEEGSGDAPLQRLCLAGGVALNCQMNTRIRDHFGLEEMFVQPAAHDGGSALGAAFVGHREITAETPFAKMDDAFLGPEYDAAEIQEALDRFGLEGSRVDDVCAETAALVARGKVVAWFQGRVEAGPRALGARSLIANPADPTVAARLNAAKGREDWRPFAPSILAGHEDAWLDDCNNDPFMLFVAGVRDDQRERVPAIVHADGTTRPQTVTSEAHPRYHRMISEFQRLSGVPLVLNTSFNTADEPIVCTPSDALDSFLHLGVDWLAMGDYLVRGPGQGATTKRLPAQRPGPSVGHGRDDQDGRTFTRLLLRLGTRCNSRCVHCTLRDLEDAPELDTEAALAALASGRERGCTEVVFMRGEPLIRPDAVRLVREAVKMGYDHVQVQTNGRMLAYPGLLDSLMNEGVTFFEVSLYGDSREAHDLIARAPGAFKQTLAGIRSLAGSGVDFMVGVPVMSANYFRLEGIVGLLSALGVQRVQFGLTRPVWLFDEGRFDVTPTVRISKAAAYIRDAIRAARAVGMRVSTEGVVLCHLDPDIIDAAEAPGALSGQLVMDLTGVESGVEVRRQSRPVPDACRSCRLEQLCPKPWAGATLMYGDSELTPYT
ncbi:MAG: radical SAM protein [Deltaproteobacteria bacterium]|nr:radical SAM protein [Deltaproteobacteria bacterium]